MTQGVVAMWEPERGRHMLDSEACAARNGLTFTCHKNITPVVQFHAMDGLLRTVDVSVESIDVLGQFPMVPADDLVDNLNELYS
jgi:hypothetical protein